MIMYLLWLQSYKHFPKVPNKSRKKIEYLLACDAISQMVEKWQSLILGIAKIVYQQLKNIADNGPLASSVAKVKEYLIKQYSQVAITNDYWSYVIWHELDDETDFDKDYCKMVEDMKASDIQRMAQKILASKRCIEVTMLSE